MSTFYFHYYEHYSTVGEPQVGLWLGLANTADCNKIHYKHLNRGCCLALHTPSKVI